MNLGLRGIAAALLLAAAPGAMGAGAEASPPDLVGWWIPVNLFARDTDDLVHKLKPEPAARYQAAVAAGRRPEEDYGYCTPPSFSGAPPPAPPQAVFEILASPGRLTMLNGQGLIRRIYLRDTPLPDALDQSRGGSSIARWEGRTLVVRTTGLYRRARPLTAVMLDSNASTVERYTLKDADTLEVVTTLTAPEIFTAPAVHTALFRRGRAAPLDLDICSEDDAAVDHATGKERFDTTPPDDLPPPPDR